MSLRLTIQNRQRTRDIHARRLRQVINVLLGDLLEIEEVELGITLVAAREMTRLNESFLRHAGSTDVITFDYSESGPRDVKRQTTIHGELFVCMDEAVLQACRFRTTWQSEVVRYVVHGILHLLGHDDHRAGDRRRMKREENRLLRRLGARFDLVFLQRTPSRRE